MLFFAQTHQSPPFHFHASTHFPVAFAHSLPQYIWRLSSLAFVQKLQMSAVYSYGLSRCDSSALMRASSCSALWPTQSRVARSESVPDVTGYYRPFERSRPLWLSEPYRRPVRLRQQYPFRRERNKQMAEVYWRDRYYYFSPLYKRAESGWRRPFESEYGSHVYSYWARYNGYGYDRQHPGFARSYFYPIPDYFG